MPPKQASVFEDGTVPVRCKLSALWTAVTLLYLYGDYFQLYQPGKLPAMLAGRTDIGPATQAMLLGMSAMLAIPALMVFLSVALPVRLNRWLNLILGILYSIIMALAVQGAWHYYLFYGVLEIGLTLTIVRMAWSWPTRTNAI